MRNTVRRRTHRQDREQEDPRRCQSETSRGAPVALVDHARAERPGLDQLQRDVFGDRRQERRAATDEDRIAEQAQLGATLMPDEPEVAGLLAVLLLAESRRASLTQHDGSLVLLAEQDCKRWDRDLINEGQTIVHRCLRRNQPGPYQLQAAINAVHADAATFERTDWSHSVGLYKHLLALHPHRRPQSRHRDRRGTRPSSRVRGCRQNSTSTATTHTTPPEPTSL